jgi:hypothetical protein
VAPENKNEAALSGQAALCINSKKEEDNLKPEANIIRAVQV